MLRWCRCCFNNQITVSGNAQFLRAVNLQAIRETGIGSGRDTEVIVELASIGP